jgi:hypothetical protein
VSEYIQELRDVIRRLHGVESEHVESVPVKEEFKGQTVWEGVVEVFNLKDHPTASRVYAWPHETDNPRGSQRHSPTYSSNEISPRRSKGRDLARG